MDSNQLRKEFLNFFEKKGHKIVPSSSLIPEDSSVLFTTAGMQQFKKYFLGEKSPYGKRVASIQKCFRTSDIDLVGDSSHLTFLEMLGNFSFGDYFKEQAIEYAFEFVTNVLKLKIQYVSVFRGDREVPRDEESVKVWKRLGVKNIKEAGREDNFWGPTGKEGPCGPTTEIYINDIEVWNIVFNEYYCNQEKKLTPLKQKGVDTGMGLERLAMVVQGKPSVFETDLFLPIFEAKDKMGRIIVDHIKGAVFLAADGIVPSNLERGYVLRRILRRAIRFGKLLGLESGFLIPLAQRVIDLYKDVYPELLHRQPDILTIIHNENEKFSRTLERGLSQLDKLLKLKVKEEKLKVISGKEAFDLYQSYGFPLELIIEIAKEKGVSVDKAGFERVFQEHKEISRAGFEGKFGGHGLLLDTGELKARDEEELKKVTRLHTATHLLQAALRKVLGDKVRQAGSDITIERTRFDFTFDRKLTKEEIQKVEDLVNQKIKEDLPQKKEEMSYQEALKSGALAFFKGKYPERVSVYSFGDFSREVCGGPHVKRTSEIGHFKIIKEESSGAGVRRIRAIVE